MPIEIDALSLTGFHDSKLSDPQWPSFPCAAPMSDMWRSIATNHQYNTLLWNEEDKARRTDVDPAEIAACKRLIDGYNQIRNDAVEAADEAILVALGACAHADDARLHSETAGAIIDRLSILSLKIFHMREQVHRADASKQHVAACGAKLQRLSMQRQDLASCFDQLLIDARAGRAYFKVYRQFKMYNDPALNPYLGGRPSRTHASVAAS